MKTENCDVVVVGFGNAAQAAAVAAHNAGAKVLVLEKAPQAKKGGNTWFSHGAQFRHTHNGIADEKPLLPRKRKRVGKIDLPPYTKDEFYADLMRNRGRSVPELAELLVNESYPTVKWMQEMGIQWEILYSAAKPKRDASAGITAAALSTPKTAAVAWSRCGITLSTAKEFRSV